jgi:hypothetical protein
MRAEALGKEVHAILSRNAPTVVPDLDDQLVPLFEAIIRHMSAYFNPRYVRGWAGVLDGVEEIVGKGEFDLCAAI